MIALLLLIIIVLGLVAWRLPRYRALTGALIAATVIGGWAWFEFAAAPPEPAAEPVPLEVLELESLELEPWFGEYRLRGTARNSSQSLVVTGFDAHLVFRDCVDGECAPLGEHSQRINLRVRPETTLEFERRIRLAPGRVMQMEGVLGFDLTVEAVHGRHDIHRERR